MPSATGRSMLTCRWRTSRKRTGKERAAGKKAPRAAKSPTRPSAAAFPSLATNRRAGYVRRPCVHHHLHHAKTGHQPAPQRTAAFHQPLAARQKHPWPEPRDTPRCAPRPSTAMAAPCPAATPRGRDGWRRSHRPGTHRAHDFRASSMVRAQAAQCIPSSTTCESQVELAGSATALASSAEPEGVQGRPKPSHSCGSSRRDTAAGSTAASEASTTGATGISGAPERNIDMVQAYPRNMTSLLTWIKPQKTDAS